MMTPSFNSPQRQSIAGILIFFGYNVQKLIRHFWFFIIYLFYQHHQHVFKIVLGTLVLLLVILVISFLNYWFFTFWINPKTNEFILKKGIINKTTIVLPVDKIQNVNLTQNVLHKLANVFKIVVESAGSSAQEVSINALSGQLALVLKEALHYSKSTNEATEDEKSQQKNFKISFVTLIKIGLTSRYRESIALFVAFIIYLGQYLEKFIENKWIDENQLEQVSSFSKDYWLMFLFMPLVIFILLMVNLIRTIFKFYNYTFLLQNDVLIFKYGLFKTREIILKPYKIQKITISQNYFQKKLGLFDIVIHQLQDQGNVNKLLDKLQIPGLNANELIQFLEMTNYQTEAFNETLFPNMRRLIIHVLFFIGLPSIIFMILKHLQVNSYQTSLLFFYAFVVLFLIIIDYKNYRFSFNEQQIKKQFGIWDVENEIVEIHKVQGIQLQQYFWQKQSNIGSITFFTSGNDIKFNTTAFDKLVKNTNIWLFKIEHSFKKWI